MYQQNKVAIAVAALCFLSAFCGCDTGAPRVAVAKPDPPRDFTTLMGVSSKDAPNATLESWDGKYDEPTEGRIINDIELANISMSESVDIYPFVLDDRIKTALRSSKQLKWLRVGRRASSSDVEWLSDLTQLHGLSLRQSDLSGANFEMLERLVDLQWLDLCNVKMPSKKQPGLATLPNLEVLMLRSEPDYMSSDQVTDNHLPSGQQSPQLRVLDIGGSTITDEGLRRLVRACPKLMYLRLVECKNITAKSATELARLKDLRYLHVGSTPLDNALYDRDYVGFPELQRALPNCYIDTGS